VLADLCAPALVALHDALLVLAPNRKPNFTRWMSTYLQGNP